MTGFGLSFTCSRSKRILGRAFCHHQRHIVVERPVVSELHQRGKQMLREGTAVDSAAVSGPADVWLHFPGPAA